MLAERPVLTRDAVEASRSHRVVAERLLRDYAQLAAGGSSSQLPPR
jgi:hypothetical protein